MNLDPSIISAKSKYIFALSIWKSCPKSFIFFWIAQDDSIEVNCIYQHWKIHGNYPGSGKIPLKI